MDAAERTALVAEWKRQTARPVRRAVAALRATEALDRLATPYAADDPRSRRRAAVALIANALHDDGAALHGTFDVCWAREQLGDEVDYVVAVERALRQELQVHPVFTMEDGG